MNYDENIRIAKAREKLVVKHNNLIQTVTRHKYELTVLEQKMIGYILSMIKPNHTLSDNHIVFDIQTFCKICGIDYDNGGNYAYIKNALEKLAQNSFWIDYGEGEMLFQWIVAPYIRKNSGIIEIDIPKKIMPYLVELKEKFTVYQLYQILALKSSYSIKLYELLLSYSFLEEYIFDLEEIKRLIQCPHKEYKDFRRYALEPAIKEINEFTNLEVAWKAIKKGRSVQQIAFIIHKKADSEATEALRNTIAELNGIKHVKGQTTIFEYIDDEEY